MEEFRCGEGEEGTAERASQEEGGARWQIAGREGSKRDDRDVLL